MNRRLVTASNTFVLSFGMYKVRIGCIALAVRVGSVRSWLDAKLWRVFSCASLCREGQVGLLRGQDASESGRRHIYFAYGVCGSQQSAWFASDAGKWGGLVSIGVCDLSPPFGLQGCS